MEQIKDMISTIFSNGCAYAVDGDAYFSIADFPEYGSLSRRNPEDNRAGERVTVDTRKINPADFALWKAAKPGEPQWDSPWGSWKESGKTVGISPESDDQECISNLHEEFETKLGDDLHTPSTLKTAIQDCEDALSAFKEECGVNGKTKFEKKLDDDLTAAQKKAKKCISNLHEEFETKLANDLHTPSILNADMQIHQHLPKLAEDGEAAEATQIIHC